MATSFSPLAYAPTTPNLPAHGTDSESPKLQQQLEQQQQQQQQHQILHQQQQQDQHQLQQQLPLMYTAAAAAAADTSGLVNIYGPAYAAAAQSRFLSSLSNPMAAAAAGETAAAAAAAAGLYGAHGCYSAAAAAGWRSQAGGYPHPGYDAWNPAAAAAASAYAYHGGNPIHDLNGQRRKNATRESTATLKAWLNEHKTNPYPTKGEKIMLAIITKMTLTQVSTWFANARRRLKKENKMTWSERNSSNDGGCDDADDGEDDAENERSGDEVETVCDKLSSSGSGDPAGITGLSHHQHMRLPSSAVYNPSLHPTAMSQQQPPIQQDQFDRPKIWSLAYTATSASASTCEQNLQTLPQQHPHHHSLQQVGHQGHQLHHPQHPLPHHLQYHQLNAAHRQHLHQVIQQQQQQLHHHNNQLEFPAIMDPILSGGSAGNFQAAAEVIPLHDGQ